MPSPFPARAWCGAVLLVLAACGDSPSQPQSEQSATVNVEPVGLALLGGSAASGRRRGCEDAKYRQFDFWVGKWDVTEHDVPAGTNHISRALDGCAVLESYAADGFVGRSLNSYDAATDQWHQHWVDHVGTILDGFGSFQDGSMTLAGVRPLPTGNNTVDRIIWTKLAPGSVRQLWEVSTDNGATFPTAQFDGLYRRVPSITPTPEVPQVACQDAALPALSQFDFTVGRWEVEVAGGPDRRLRSRIFKDLSDCLIEERIQGAGGYEAIVFTSVRRRLGIWVKTYVDNQGANAFLTGGLTEGAMVLRGTAPSPKGKALDVRVVYSQKGADRFEQRWEKTRDGGATWDRLALVKYRRR